MYAIIISGGEIVKVTITVHIESGLLEQVESLKAQTGISRDFELFLQRHLYPYIPIMQYRDYLRTALFRRAGIRSEGGDPRPWQEKPWLDHLLRQPVFARAYDPRPFDTGETNLNVYFLHRIAQFQQSGHVLFFLSPVNQALLTDLLKHPGYEENIHRIEQIMASIRAEYPGVEYLNLERALDPGLFSDNLHLTANGYARLATILWDHFVGKMPPQKSGGD